MGQYSLRHIGENKDALSQSTQAHRALGDLLVDGGFITNDDLESALACQTLEASHLGEVLIRQGKIDQQTLNATLRLQKVLDRMARTVDMAHQYQMGVLDDLKFKHLISRQQFNNLMRMRPSSRYSLAKALLRFTSLKHEQIQDCLSQQDAISSELRDRAGLRLGDLLVISGEISARQLKIILRKQRVTGRPFGELLIEMGWLDRRRLNRSLDLQKHLSMAAIGATMAFGQAAHAQAQADAGSTFQDSETQIMVAMNTSSAPAALHKKRHKTGKKTTTQPDPRWASLTADNPVDNTEQQPLYDPNDSDHDQRWASLKSGDEQELAKLHPTQRKQTLKKKRQAERAARLAQKKQQRLAATIPLFEELHPVVKRHADTFDLPPDLIYAIIQTESSFNPKAKSGMNAHGLMQVVPSTGGAEVYQKLDGKQGKPSRQQLIDPDTNVRIGTAYLRILMNHYFPKVENPEVRLNLTIAAYNMGPSRLVRLIRKKGAPRDMAAFHAMLQKHAPKETRDYVRKVNKRRHTYIALLDTDASEANV